jgi:hypothetical protein
MAIKEMTANEIFEFIYSSFKFHVQEISACTIHPELQILARSCLHREHNNSFT